MVLVQCCGLTVQHIKDSGFRAKLMVMEDLSILMVTNTLACGKMIKLMGGEYHIRKMITTKEGL